MSLKHLDWTAGLISAAVALLVGIGTHWVWWQVVVLVAAASALASFLSVLVNSFLDPLFRDGS
jgi:hypothetical protein